MGEAQTEVNLGIESALHEVHPFVSDGGDAAGEKGWGNEVAGHGLSEERQELVVKNRGGVDSSIQGGKAV